MPKDSIRGQVVVSAPAGLPFAQLRVEAWDRDLKIRAPLGTAATDANGAFVIKIDERVLRDLTSRLPDVYFKVFRGDQQVADTRSTVLWSPRYPDAKVVILLGDAGTAPGTPGIPHPATVEGRVTTENGRAVVDVQVEVWDQRLGGDVLFSKTVTDAKGHYSTQYDPVEIGSRGRPDLYVRILDPRRKSTEIGRSAVSYDAGQTVVIDVKVPADRVSRASEYERLLEALAPVVANVSLQTLDPKGVEVVANRVRWDARTVAMAAQAAKLSAETKIPAEHYYALMRAGLPGERAALHRMPEASIRRGLEQAITSGIITPSQSIDTTVEIHRREAAAALRQFTPVASVSSLGDMLKLSLNEGQTNTFLAAYQSTTADPKQLWTTLAERGFDSKLIARLQTDGKLGYLTRQNAPLIGRLRQAAQVEATEDLVRAGLYKASAWKPLIGADVPAGISADSYAEGLAAQINLSYRTLVTAEMVRRRELPIDPPSDGEGEVAAFLRAGHGQHTIGVEPVRRWEGYAALSAEGKNRARLVERLYQMSPSNDAMVALHNAGLHSALQIVSQPKARFLAQHGGEFLDQAQAALVYQKAQEIHTTVLNMATMYLSYRSSPNVYAMTGDLAKQAPGMQARATPAGAPRRFADVLGTPALEDLLGNMDYCACDACKSVLGPAAYFVELLQFCNVTDVPVGKQNPIDVLFARRPDLQHLLLSCENTNIALPYIDIINEVLEYYIVNGNLTAFKSFNMREDSKTADILADPERVEDAAYVTTKAAVFPQPLPFDMPLDALRLLVKAWDTTLADALRVFGTPTDARREVLALNAPELSILTNTGFHTLPEYFGQPANATIDQLNSAIAEGKTFCRTVAITYEELVDILRTRFINAGAPLVSLLQALAVDLQHLQSWYTGTLDDNGLRALLPDTIDPSDYGGDVLTWLTTNRQLIMGLITLTDVSDDAQECSFADVELRFALPDSAANRLTDLAYWKLLRFIRLWRKLGWSRELTDTAMTTFLGMAPELLTMGNIDATFQAMLARLANFVDLTRRQQISSKLLDDWLAIWDTAATADIRRDRLAHLLKIGSTDLAHFSEITGIDPLADDMETDAPSLLRFIDAWKAFKATGLKVVDVDYLLRHRDDGGLIAPSEAALLRDLKALRDGLTAIASDLGTPPDDADLAFARSKLALVYDGAVVDRFLGLIGGNTTYAVAFPTTEETLPAKLTAVDARLGFDPLQKELTSQGIMSAATVAALSAAAGTLVLADMSVIAAQPDLDAYIAAFRPAVQNLADEGQADVDAFDAEYHELKLVYDAVAPISDPATQVKALIEQILPALRERLKALSLRATLASQLKLEQPLVDVLAEGPSVLHAIRDGTKGVLQDFLDLEFPVTFGANQTYTFRLDPPTTDDYILYVGAPAGTSVTLTVRGIAAIPATIVPARDEVQSGVPVPLVAGALTPIALTLAGLPAGETAELRWRTNGMAKVPVPSARLYDDNRVANARASLLRLQKAGALIRRIELTPQELRHLASVNVDTRGFLDAIDVDGSISPVNLHAQWTRISWLAWFSRLKADEPDPDTWVGLLEQPGRLTPQNTLVLAAAAGWRDADLNAVLTRFGLIIADLTLLHEFRRVKDAVDFVVATQQTAADLLAWITAAPNTALINTIKQRLRDAHTELAWRTTLQSVNDPLRNLRRDAMVAYILHHAPPTPSIDTADKLYEHFLIDVEMDACMLTSRIRLALSTVQLFIGRCLMNLEPDVAASSIRPDHWAWMKRYRVWEANRKIYLYPENWLEPELRDGKSSFFTELQAELLKADITDELAESAYLAYLKKLDEVARLEIRGCYLQEGEAGNQDDDILHVFGRTIGNTHQYYYRRYEYGYWTPWEKVTLQIEGDLVFPVIWKQQLFVFWLSPVRKPEGADSSKDPQTLGGEPWGSSAKISAELNICWGEYYKGKWTSPKSSELTQAIRLTGMSVFEPEKIFIAARTEKPSPDVSERLIMNIGYLGTPTQGFGVTFTSKNAPPTVGGGDWTLFTQVELFNYLLLWDPQPTSLLDSNSLRIAGKVFEVRLLQPSGASAATLDETVLTKTNALLDGSQVRPLMHPVKNQWEAPLFYSDEHSIFFMSPDEHVDLVAHYEGYFWNDVAAVIIPPDRLKIPPMYEEPVIPDPIGPVAHPLVDLINPQYEHAISDNSRFTFAGTAFDAQGTVMKGGM